MEIKIMKNSVVLSMLLALTVLTSPVFGDAKKYTVDSAHSEVGFQVRYLGISNVKGEFPDASGTIVYDAKKPEKSSFVGEVKVSTVDTSNTKRDDHLKSDDFFAARQFPKITFVSKSIASKGKGKLDITGDFTMRGVTEEVTIPVEISGPVVDPYGNERIAFEGEFEVNRKDYGINWNKTTDKGGIVVGDTVKIMLEIQGILN